MIILQDTSRTTPMNRIRPFLALLLTILMMSPAGFAQAPAAPDAQATPKASPDAYQGLLTTNLDQPIVPVAKGGWLLRPYQQPDIAPVNLQNSTRLESLLRAGKIYLSLQDTIALALENNLDIELSRYTPQIAQADLLRAKAGGLLRGVSTSVRQGPSSALSGAGISSGGTTGGAGLGSGGGGTVNATEGGVGGTVITQTGVAVPVLDPQVFFGYTIGHLSRPQANTITTGGRTGIAIDYNVWNAGYQQNFLTGTQVSATWNNTWSKNNNPFNDLNPNYQANVGVQISQRLLQGFGLAVNNRNIKVAKNDIRVGDLTFKLQVMTTVSAVVNLYWDLVSFNEDVRVKQKALEVAKKFYEDNKKQVEIGTLAPIEIVRAEARVAQAEQDLTNSETALLQQETIVKNALSKNGIASPSVAEARIIPTDRLSQPDNDTVSDLKTLTETALAQRPDLEQTKIQLDNTKIALAGSRSQLLPSLDVQASFQNNGLTGQPNSVSRPPLPPATPDLYFVGGYGNALAQIFRRNFPDYSVGFQLNIPIRNRQAQADYIRDRLTLRQQEISAQRQVNDLRVNVQNALTAVVQARARYAAAVKERQLQEQTLDAENKKYALGASTAFQVVQTQRDLANAQASEVSALAAYSRARVQLDLQTAQILPKYNVDVAEAYRGEIKSKPVQSIQGL
jgi:outer membrane protein TolC